MLFVWDITVPAGTSDATPTTQKLILLHGVIERIEVKFASGCHGLVKIRFTKSGSVIVPTNPNAYITGDGESVTADINYTLPSGSSYISFEGSSPTTSYDHIITVRIELIVPAEEKDVIPILQSIVKSLDTEFEPNE